MPLASCREGVRNGESESEDLPVKCVSDSSDYKNDMFLNKYNPALCMDAEHDWTKIPILFCFLIAFASGSFSAGLRSRKIPLRYM